MFKFKNHVKIVSRELYLYKKYPYLFHKYLLNIRMNTNIPYVIIQSQPITNEFICHLHIFDLDLFEEIYGKYINDLIEEFQVIVTFVKSTKELNYPVCILKINNQGFDVGGKLCCLQFIKEFPYSYILFLHSKSNKKRREEYFNPLIKNKIRIKLCKNLMKYKNISGLFPNIIWNKDADPDTFKSNELYYNELTSFLNIKKNYIFSEGNVFFCTRQVVDSVFVNYSLFYNILNDEHSFDYNWWRIIKKNNDMDKLYKMSIGNTNNFSPILRDGMIEHAIERIWLDMIIHLKKDYLVLDEKNSIDTYKIKINAIYFPQFHEIPENNEFWGEHFTEWTLLEPFEKTMIIKNIEYPVLKPHHDIGYYTLTKEHMKSQTELAKQFNINGFIVYHYWFGLDHKVMYKPLEYLKEITFPFAISWANELWSKRWDGSNHEILIQQDYPRESYLLHIQYLIPFFKLPHYIKNDQGECIFYIYMLPDIPSEMFSIWKEELKKHNLKIKFINTENSFGQTHNCYENNFIFEPMYSGCYLNCEIVGNAINTDYMDILNRYRVNTFGNKHLGLPLYWNNKVRRKNNNYTNITNYSIQHLEELLLLLIAEQVSKYKNVYNLSALPSFENFININAWNEWNEQAVLEPNCITGYDNLNTIYNVTNNV